MVIPESNILLSVLDLSLDKLYSPQLSCFLYRCTLRSDRAQRRNENFNTGQRSQFTSEDFTVILKQNDITIRMVCKRRWVDNVFVERLWRCVRYEEVYLHA